jgi:hypothetical protein
MWYVYVDWTLELIPRPFYVGKGNEYRIGRRDRDNDHWRHIAEKHGWRRELVMGTKDEAFALAEEKRLIKEHRTFYGHDDYIWGANKTLGGEGTTGAKHTGPFFNISKKTGAWRARMSSSNPMFDDETRQRHTAFMKSEEHRHFQSVTNTGAGNGNAKLTVEDVLKIRRLRALGVSQIALARQFKVSHQCISRIVLRETWACV